MNYGKQDRYDSSLSGLALHVNVTIVPLDDLLYQRQPQADSKCFRAEQWLENVIRIFQVYTASIVDNA